MAMQPKMAIDAPPNLNEEESEAWADGYNCLLMKITEVSIQTDLSIVYSLLLTRHHN